MSSTLLSGTVIKSRVVMSVPEGNTLSSVSVDDVTISGDGSEDLPIQIKQSYQDALTAAFASKLSQLLTANAQVNGNEVHQLTIWNLLNLSLEALNTVAILGSGGVTVEAGGNAQLRLIAGVGGIALDTSLGGNGIIISKLPATDNTLVRVLSRDVSGNVRMTLLYPSVDTFATDLTFNYDKDLATVTGGTRTFTLAASGHLNGVGIVARINAPVAVNFPASFESVEGSSSITTTGMNIIVFRYFENYNGSGTDKVLYLVKNQAAL